MSHKRGDTEYNHIWIEYDIPAAYKDGLSIPDVAICSRCIRSRKIEYAEGFDSKVDILLFPFFVIVFLILGAFSSIIILGVLIYSEIISPFARKIFN